MFRYRITFLLLTTHLLFTSSEDVPTIAEDRITNTKPPDKLVLNKSTSYLSLPQDNTLLNKFTNWIKNPFGSGSSEKNSEHDLNPSASQHIGAKYVSYFSENSRDCYACNSQPWIPIGGRSLHFPQQPSHSNSLDDNFYQNNQPYFKEKHVHKQYDLFHPPIDQYGAPQDVFDYPRMGEVVDFMLPPPSNHQNFPNPLYGSLQPTYSPPKNLHDNTNPVYRPSKQTYNFGSTNFQPTLNVGSPHIHQKIPKPIYNSPSNIYLPSHNYGSPLGDISPPPVVSYGPLSLPSNNYGPPPHKPNNYRLPANNYVNTIPTTHLRPVSQDFQPPPPVSNNYNHPQVGINHLPLENVDLPLPIPSDSYGKPFPPVTLPVSDQKFPSVAPSDSYGSPVSSYVEPITLGSGDSEDYGKHLPSTGSNYIGSVAGQIHNDLKSSLYQKGLTDVQVVPSVRIADYTASVEHPINIVQSPIFDLNVKAQTSDSQTPSDHRYGGEIKHNQYETVRESNFVQESNKYHSGQDNSYQDSLHRLSENPIVVDDTYTSASNINTTTYAQNESSTASKRHNDKFLSSETFQLQNNDVDITSELIKKLILEQNIITDPKDQIVGIQKAVIDPQKVHTSLSLAKPSLDYSSWNPKYKNQVSTVMVPPKSSKLTWISPANQSFVTTKSAKKLQIIVPYLKAPQTNSIQEWNNSPKPYREIYNREYTTLAPVFIPPAMSTESASLWTKFVEDFKTLDSHKDPAKGFTKPSPTGVYNIKEFLATQQQHHLNKNHLPYDVISLQKNIDHWTHQEFSNKINFGDKITTKLVHVKNIPQEYFSTTPGYGDNNEHFSGAGDHVGASSDNRNFVSKEIEENFIDSEKDTTTTTTAISTTTEQTKTEPTTLPTVRYIMKQQKPSWESSQVTLSNSTYEKVYVVTPQSYTNFLTSTAATAFSMAPKIQNGKVNNVNSMTRISVRVEPPGGLSKNEKELKPIKVVYSEWPHLINNLETTTTTARSTSRHPLFGLMDLAAYTPPPNSTVETIGGQSRVTSVVTPLVKHKSTTPVTPSTNFNKTVNIFSTL